MAKRSSQTSDKSAGAHERPSARLSDAVPRQGHVLSAVAERLGAPVRRAVAELQSGLVDSQCLAEGGKQSLNQRSGCVERSSSELAAWGLVAKWLVGVASGTLSGTATLAEAEAWFNGSPGKAGVAPQFDERILTAAQKMLPHDADRRSLAELMPYILDPHGQASRLTVRSRPETVGPRATKRAQGVFYTPEDVADFMVGRAVASTDDSISQVTVLDPACGTGVFLRAALKALKSRRVDISPIDLVCGSLFGTDIDSWVVDAAAYVLLLDVLERRQTKKNAPGELWKRIRQNFACIDALLIDPAAHVKGRRKTRPGSNRVPVDRVFPRLRKGPTLVVGNPPYAELGQRADMLELTANFLTLPETPRGKVDFYPLFIEQMVRLANPAGGGALVVPLSVAVNSGRQFVATRRFIGKTPGEWRFAFFDREPHALFGEDVKTRNAIICWSRGTEQTSRLSTGPLRKWRGANRAEMFEKIRYTPLVADISNHEGLRGLPEARPGRGRVVVPGYPHQRHNVFPRS
ncbi:MAG: N-6 DNA methylase [Betaproteobacteria bacterium]